MRAEGTGFGHGGGWSGDTRVSTETRSFSEKKWTPPPSPTRIRFHTPERPPEPPKKRDRSVQNHDYDRREVQPNVTPPEKIAAIVDLYKKGWSARAVGEKVGVSRVTVLRYIKEADLKVRGARRPVSDEALIADYAKGLSMREVGRRNGVSNTTVRNRLAAAGVEIRARRKN